MAKLNMTKAAEAVGITRQALYQHIETKSISVERDDKGKPVIDTSELLRVYGRLQEAPRKQTARNLRQLTPANDTENSVLQVKLEAEKEKNALLRDQVADLARRLDDSEKERRADKEKFLAAPVLAPVEQAPEPEAPALPENPAPERGGLFSRLKAALKP